MPIEVGDLAWADVQKPEIVYFQADELCPYSCGTAPDWFAEQTPPASPFLPVPSGAAGTFYPKYTVVNYQALPIR